ncbi:oxygenase MpaB family protein [Conexibacter sp. SYSU D00693]|uniref:oxygenase MpaB family protein n=1 Tax=Conexibacter sp. SYSU D00693 TaxID=2812560 RepID=UPI00196A8F05|nr:oxygenase MpaB family protein [Conexibacter sp. SYSU D00693]
MASVLPDPEEYAALSPEPGGPVWRAFNDVRMLSTSGYATLLQVAHPTVGAGVHHHSSFTKDPWGRLLRTLDYVHGTIYGGPELAGTIGRRVRELHRTIRGTKADGGRYSAMEPGAFAWVHATLALAIVRGRDVFATPMTPAEKDELWTEWLGVGRLIGVRERDLPRDWAGAEAYLARTIREELEWTPAVPEVLDTIAHAKPPNVPGLPPAVWRAMRVPLAVQLRATTVGLLPDELRDRLGLTWSRRERAAFAAVASVSRASGPAVRGPLANFGPNYVRWRREALARGDVARAGSVQRSRAAAA